MITNKEKKGRVKALVAETANKRIKLTAQQCYFLKLWANMSNTDWDELRAGLREYGLNDLYCSKHIHRTIGKETKQNIINELGVNELPDTNGGAFVSIRKAILYILLLFCPNYNEKTSSWWKLMLDGRPKGNFL